LGQQQRQQLLLLGLLVGQLLLQEMGQIVQVWVTPAASAAEVRLLLLLTAAVLLFERVWPLLLLAVELAVLLLGQLEPATQRVKQT
jgi:hypothetical protein